MILHAGNVHESDSTLFNLKGKKIDMSRIRTHDPEDPVYHAKHQTTEDRGEII